MSKIALSGNASGTGTLTISAPNTSTDRTLTLPDATGTVQVSGNPISGTTGTFSGDLTLGSSTLATPTGSAPSYLCRAWVNFNGQGTVAIRASGNVSSITDAGTGNYRVNFTTAMPDGNYSAVGTVNNNQGTNYAGEITFADGDVSASQVRIFTSISSGNALFDPAIVCVSIFR